MSTKIEKEIMEQKLLFIMDHLSIVSSAACDHPAFVYYYLFDDQKDGLREELVQFLIQCDEVTQPTCDVDSYYLLRGIFHNLTYYIQKCYTCGFMLKEKYEASLQQIRGYCKMIPEPNIKFFRLSRMMERDLLQKNR